MGRDKAAIVIDGQTLLQRAVSLLSHHVSDVFVSVRPDQQDDPARGTFSLIVDAQSDVGPAAGILAAHAAHPDAAWLVVACDMPNLSHGEISTLVTERDERRSATAFVASEQDDPEPLCAIYEPGTLASFAALVVAGGNPSPKRWLKSVDVRLVASTSRRALKSANTMGDIENLDS